MSADWVAPVATDTVPDNGPYPGEPAWPTRPPSWRHDAPDPPESFVVPATIADGLLLAFWTIFAQVLVLIPLGLIGVIDLSADAPVTVSSLAMIIVVQVVTLGGALLFLRARGHLSWRLLGPVRARFSHVGVGLLIGISGYLMIIVLLIVVQEIVGEITPPDQDILTAVDTSLLHTLISFAAAVVVAPILEEFIFRGVLFQAMRTRLGLWPAVGMSSIIWGVAHLFDQPFYMVIIAILGVWLALAYHRTGSLLVPIVGHAVFNGVQLVLLLTTSAAS